MRTERSLPRKFAPPAWLASLALAAAACAPTWDSKLLANSRQVALALNDPAELPAQPFDPATVPVFDPPKKLRPCCAFGQDLQVRVGKLPIPLYELGNVIGPDEIGPHGYDKGDLTREKNGVLYTCRGGFIDLAHVRDNADRTLFLAMRIARALPDGVTVDFPEEGTLRRVIVRPLPPGLLARHGRWNLAIALSAWANHQLSNWHEIVTWYGWESVKGMSERLSAFSPEDIYSNVLGINIAAGILVNREGRSREQYEESMQAWIAEALRRLGAVPKAQARAAMSAVDGLWWDSSKRVPDFDLVTRRFLDLSSPVEPWTVPALAGTCDRLPAPLPLIIREALGDTPIEELATVRFEFVDWVPGRFPLPAGKGKAVTQADFPKILADIRQQGADELGPDFDQPGPPARASEPQAAR